MDSSTGGIIGGVVGSVIGLAGGVIGTYFSMKNTRTPAERAFMVRVAVAMWCVIAVLAAVAVLTFTRVIPNWSYWVLMGVFFCLLGPAIVWTNRQQARLRAQDADHEN